MSAQPVLKDSSRIEVIDVLRGFSLLGIIMVHTVEQYYAGVMPAPVVPSNPSLMDQIVEGFVGIFVVGKFYMIFSFLFGLSFSIQLDKSNGGAGFFLRFAWRLVLLFAIGMLHHLHYRGDILSIYAPLGFTLLIVHRLSDRHLLIAALLLVFNVPSVLIRLATGILSPDANQFAPPAEEELTAYYEAAKMGNYPTLLRMHLAYYVDKMEFQYMSGRIFVTTGLFFLGLYAGRKNFFASADNYLPIVRSALKLSWKVLLGAILFAAIFFGGAQLLKLHVPNAVNFSVGGFLYDLFNATLAAVYTGSILIWFQRERMRKILMQFYELGRMGLTTYLLQSFFGLFIFFGFGFGLLNEVPAILRLLMAFGIFFLQLQFSKIWFRHFNYGFFEWIWRAFTYFTVPPMKKRSPAQKESTVTLS